jgi:hypothetical protein
VFGEAREEPIKIVAGELPGKRLRGPLRIRDEPSTEPRLTTNAHRCQRVSEKGLEAVRCGSRIVKELLCHVHPKPLPYRPLR